MGVLASLTENAICLLDRLTRFSSVQRKMPAHQRIGRRGEEAAYFYLRRQGYVMVARNYRSTRRRGEIDLIGWDKDILCFIEVKTRTSDEVKPAEAAIDFDKKQELGGMAREYLRRLPTSVPWRFDVVSVYYGYPEEQARIELFKNAFPVA